MIASSVAGRGSKQSCRWRRAARVAVALGILVGVTLAIAPVAAPAATAVEPQDPLGRSAAGEEPTCLTTRLTGPASPTSGHAVKASVSSDGLRAWLLRESSTGFAIEEVDLVSGEVNTVIAWSPLQGSPGYLDFEFADFSIDSGLIVGWTNAGVSAKNLATLSPGLAGSGDVTQVTDLPHGWQWLSQITLSGDGSTVVFNAPADLTGSNPELVWQIFTWRPSSGFVQRTAMSSEVDLLSQPTSMRADDDASHIYFSGMVSSDRELFQAVGDEVTQITEPGSTETPAAGSGMVVDADGDTVVFVGASGPFGDTTPPDPSAQNVWRWRAGTFDLLGSVYEGVPIGLDPTGETVLVNSQVNTIERWQVGGDSSTVAYGQAGSAVPLEDGSILWNGQAWGGNGYDTTGLPPASTSELYRSDPCGVSRPGDPTAQTVAPSCFDPDELTWSATVSWGLPAHTGGLPLIGWRVMAMTGSMNLVVVDISDPATLSQTMEGLSLVPHAIGVYAVTAWGRSASATPIVVQPPSTPCTPPGPTFPDVPMDHPFFAEVEWMAANGITTGYPSGLFGPGDPVSRGAMSAFMYRLAGSPAFEPPSSPSFPDVPVGHPFFAEVEWMAANEITTGTPDGTFASGRQVSRGSMSAFMYRLHGVLEEL